MRVVGFDTETSIAKSIHGSSFRDPTNDVYTLIYAYNTDHIEVEHKKNGFERTLPDRLLDGVDLIIGHNLTFDLSYFWEDSQLQNFLKRGGKIHCTQQTEYILTGQQHAFSSLAELQLKYLGQIEKPSRISLLYKDKYPSGKKKTPTGADAILAASTRCPRVWDLYNKYSISDGRTPLQIYERQLAMAKEKDMLEIVQLYNDYLLSVINMTCTGALLDTVACEKLERDLNIRSIECLQKAQAIIAPMWDKRLPDFNVNSNDHKSVILFGGWLHIDVPVQHGCYNNGKPKFKKEKQPVHIKGFGVPTKITREAAKEGFYSTDDKVMNKIAKGTKNPQLKEYCELQKQAMTYKKMANTYCRAFLDRNVNGILHPNYNTTTTKTGRLSSSQPNLQNIPSKSELATLIEGCFMAPQGWTCVSIDFSQLEIWVLAMLSKDALLTEHLLKGIDLHIVRLQYYNSGKTYEELVHLCKTDDYWSKQRSKAKTVSYQRAYGAMPKKVAESTGLSLEVVEQIYHKENETYVAASMFGDLVRDIANSNLQESREVDIPAANKKGKEGSKFHNGIELLPIFDTKGEVGYNKNHVRCFGTYKSILGMEYRFLETGRDTKYGFKKSISFTETKNYPVQGTASIIQAITTVALLPILLEKSDRIKMVMEIHDSKRFYIRNDVLQPCLKWLKQVIEDVPKLIKDRFNIDVPFKFPVEIEIGKNFEEMEKYNV